MNILRYAFKNISRNIFLSITSIVVISLLVFFVNILLFILFATERFIDGVNDRISITINFRDEFNAGDPRALSFIGEVTGSFTGISTEYISREDAFSILKNRDPDLALIIENTSENPLPNSIKISKIGLGEYKALNNTIARFQDILQYDATDMDKKLLDYRAQYARISVIVEMLHSLEKGIYILLALFVFTVFAIVHMIIRNFIYYLQDEVQIIELVG